MAKNNHSTRRGALLAALGGASVAALPAAVAAAPEPVALPPPFAAAADAELVRLCDEYVAAERQFYVLATESSELPSSSPRYKELCAQESAVIAQMRGLREAITDQPAPLTVGGFKALARAAHARLADGGEDADHPMDSDTDLAWMLVQAVRGMPA